MKKFLLLITILILIVGCGQQQIQPTQPISKPSEPIKTEVTDCSRYSDKLDLCEPFSCEFQHPITGEMLEKRIIGLINGKCRYTEEMPGSGKTGSGIVDCEYSESVRRVIAQFQRDIDNNQVKTLYTVNGKQVQNPMQEALNIGQCTISDIKHIPLPERTPELEMGFKSNKPCKSILECLRPTPLCFEGYCVTANDALKEYIYDNYEYGNCLSKTCEGCEKGNLQLASIGQDGYRIEYCIECSGDHVFRCKQGYECVKGKCIGSPSISECNIHSDCATTQICQNNQCTELQCTGCRTIINHQCLPLGCCSDSDCDDENPNTEDKCISPATADSHCVNNLIELDNVTQEEESSCTSDADCSDNKYCLARSCLTIEEFYSQNFGCCEQGVTITINEVDYSDCGFMATLTSNMMDCLQISCPNCVQGSQRCVAHPKGLADLPFYNCCVECIRNTHCKQGYVCENRMCVTP